MTEPDEQRAHGAAYITSVGLRRHGVRAIRSRPVILHHRDVLLVRRQVSPWPHGQVEPLRRARGAIPSNNYRIATPERDVRRNLDRAGDHQTAGAQRCRGSRCPAWCSSSAPLVLAEAPVSRSTLAQVCASGDHRVRPRSRATIERSSSRPPRSPPPAPSTAVDIRRLRDDARPWRRLRVRDRSSARST